MRQPTSRGAGPRLPAGLAGPTKAQAAGPGWRRTSKGLHVPAHVDPTCPEQRALEQAQRLPAGGAVSGWAACRLHGARYFDGRGPRGTGLRPVLLVQGTRGRVAATGDVEVSREPLGPDEVVLREGVPVTVAVRALFDELRRIPDWRGGVVALDMAAAAGLVSVRRLGDYHAQRSGWRRTTRVARVLRWASERSRSPAETRTRLVWEVDAGLPRLLVNQEIFTHSGHLVAVADLLDPVAGVVVEYDGSAHRRTRRRHRDIGREESLRRLQLEYVAVVGPDLLDRARLADRMASTRGRARFLDPHSRPWTLEPPEWWPREESLDERLLHLDLARAWDRDLRALEV